MEATAADPDIAAPAVDVPERSAPPATPPAPRTAGNHRTGGRTPRFGTGPTDDRADHATTDGGRRTRSYFFSDDEPTATGLPRTVDAPASPRPRFPSYEDVTDQPGEGLPISPVASPHSQPVPSAPSRPVAARHLADAGSEADPTGGTSSTTGTPDRTEAPTEEARVEPMPRPRHLALPDLGRGTRWDAFANARRATPVLPNAPQARGRHAGTTESPGPSAAGLAEEPGDAKSKLRGLFRRNRAKGEPADGGREAEALAAQDEEYVDWVAGLASDSDGENIPSLRSGRHYRD